MSVSVFFVNLPAEVASQAEPSTTVPFYKQWWFLLSMAVAGVAIVLVIVASLCITGRRRAKTVSKGIGSKLLLSLLISVNKQIV